MADVASVSGTPAEKRLTFSPGRGSGFRVHGFRFRVHGFRV